MTTDNKLNDTWDFWFHDPLDNNWKLDSYKKIHSINTIQSFWNLYNFLDNKMIENSMLFLMRQNIEPLWEHKDNINGGCWSLKIQKGDIYNLWNSISISLLSENISNDENININGISISPKKNFCIIKFWTNKITNNTKTLKPIKHLSYEGIIFKPHNIH
jgi:hypothetical protein